MEAIEERLDSVGTRASDSESMKMYSHDTEVDRRIPDYCSQSIRSEDQIPQRVAWSDERQP